MLLTKVVTYALVINEIPSSLLKQCRATQSVGRIKKRIPVIKIDRRLADCVLNLMNLGAQVKFNKQGEIYVHSITGNQGILKF